jgi:hypothetical protein
MRPRPTIASCIGIGPLAGSQRERSVVRTSIMSRADGVARRDATEGPDRAVRGAPASAIINR